MQTIRVVRADRSERLMWLSDQRVFYAGLLGSIDLRTSGGWSFYVSPEGLPNRVRLGSGAWQSGELIVVPPQVAHCIESQQPLILTLVIESEFVDAQALAPQLRQCGVVDDPAFVRRVRAGHQQLLAASGRECFNRFDFDRLFFGQPLPQRVLDARIRAVVERVSANPAQALSAEQCAEDVNLSFSRFLHLFKEQTGMTFRAFRAWKRARSLLRHVQHTSTLTDIALDTGYPDSTHFSHSIRQFYGLKPSDILAGSRRISLHDAAGQLH